jgi:membrane-associated HD superfamily phosphohydrolase
MELSSIINNGSNLEVSSLSKSLEDSNLPLHQCLDEKSIWFLTACGLYWTKEPYYLPIIWSVIVLLIASTFYIIYGPFDVVVLGTQQRRLNVVLLVDVGVTFQGIAMIFIVVHTRARIHQIVKKIDLFMFPECRRIAFICLLVFFGTYFPFINYIGGDFVGQKILANVILGLGLLSSSAILSVNLLFLVIDAKVSVTLLTSLIEQDSISVEEYNRVKAEVDDRVSKSRMNNNAVMGMALTNVIIVFLMFIISDNIASNLEDIFIIIVAMSREVIMLSLDFGLLHS